METSQESISSRFARVYGSPGEAPRVLGLLRAFWPLLVICFVTGFLLRELLPLPDMELSTVGVLFFLVAVATAVLLAWGDRRLGNYLKGAKGEEWVAHELAFLSAEYTVFNGLRLGGGKQNFDHIIVGPGGVFVVETKNWKGSVEFRDGKLFAGGKEPSRPPLRQVKAATAELVAYVDDAGGSELPVHSVLCFLGTRLPEEVMNVNGVVVCSGTRLLEVLQETFDNPVSLALREQVVHELRKVIE
ncbi:MAG: NERD domain-containing protein [Pontiellaceae bacterium]|nr:NERD domain-containing protein [Pontiellaceae bacterium]MBN2785111.1 NERD domain-containing protein [Pontiellaceae bacterium]